MPTIEYTFRIQKADWNFDRFDLDDNDVVDPIIGTRKVICYHQFVDDTGVAVALDDPNGDWQPFVPGPEIRGNVGDTIVVTVQNRIDDDALEFVEGLKTSAIVHWHGIELGNAHDGTPVTQRPIPTGQDFVYRFKLIRPGVFWYHPHFDGLLQEHLGSYGPIIVEDDSTATLRTENIIPHEDRSFCIALSDVSFQSGRTVDPIDAHIPRADFPLPVGTDAFIRNIEAASGNQNFGDVWLVNGLHGKPFNAADANVQQFWAKGQKANPQIIQVAEGESISCQILNTGLHRFYKIHLAFKNGPGDWQVSNDLFWIGGQGGLLNNARGGGGDFDSGNVDSNGDPIAYRVRGRKARNADGAQAPQSASDLLPGEFVLATSARIELAFAVQAGWTEVALRVNGFNVQNSGGTTQDEDPDNMLIAHFPVGGVANPDYVLGANLAAGTPLLMDPSVDVPGLPAEDKPVLENLAPAVLEGLPSVVNEADVVTAFAGCGDGDDKATLAANGVGVPAGPLSLAYDPTLTGNMPGPSIDGESVHWNMGGPFQATADNTRYLQKNDVVEWTVETGTAGADHPWHMHGFSFQPIKMELNIGGGNYETLYDWQFVEYVDSIHVPAFHRLTLRFRVEDRMYIGEDGNETANGVVGRWLAHCHITKHAHRGMMMNFYVVDGCDLDEYQRVDVYLRDNIADDGTEPSTGSISGSPDIIVRPDEVLDPMAEFGPGSGTENSSGLGFEAEFGQDNYIYARVNNRGNQPGNVTTDVYWSEVATLVTPDTWSYIGQTGPMVVQPGVLTVSDAIVWPPNEIPATGHYCFIGVTGSEQDIKSISPNEAASYPEFADFDDFRAFIRGHNNVTWRNFNVVDVDLNNAPGSGDDAGAGAAGDEDKSARFKFRGAFDKPRLFDLVVYNPFERLALEMPDDAGLRRDLDRRKVNYSLRKKTISVDVPVGEIFRLRNMRLEKNRDYRSRFVVGDELKSMIGKTLAVAQEHIDDYVRKIADAEAQLHEHE